MPVNPLYSHGSALYDAASIETIIRIAIWFIKREECDNDPEFKTLARDFQVS